MFYQGWELAFFWVNLKRLLLHMNQAANQQLQIFPNWTGSHFFHFCENLLHNKHTLTRISSRIGGEGFLKVEQHVHEIVGTILNHRGHVLAQLSINSSNCTAEQIMKIQSLLTKRPALVKWKVSHPSPFHQVIRVSTTSKGFKVVRSARTHTNPSHVHNQCSIRYLQLPTPKTVGIMVLVE